MAREQQDTVMTIDELAVHLKLSKSTLYHFARDGKAPGVKVGRHWRSHGEATDARMRGDGKVAPTVMKGSR